MAALGLPCAAAGAPDDAPELAGAPVLDAPELAGGGGAGAGLAGASGAGEVELLPPLGGVLLPAGGLVGPAAMARTVSVTRRVFIAESAHLTF